MRLLRINRRFGGNGLGCAYVYNWLATLERRRPGFRDFPAAPKGNGAGQISKGSSPLAVGWRFSGSLTMQLADFALKKFDGQLSLTQ